VGIVVAVAIPGPARTGIEQLTFRADLFKSGAIDAPDVPVPRGNGARGIYEGKAPPRHGNLGGPAAVNFVPLVQRTVYVNGVPKSGAIPVQKAPALASRMHMAAYAVEYQNALLIGVELGESPPLPARSMHILPDPEHLVDDATGANLEFVVSIGAGDKDFEVVLLVNLRVAFGKRAPDVVSSAVKPK
jgi:hypothetical protein